MKRKNEKRKRLIIILVLFLLTINVAYALLGQDLTINGTTNVKGNSWDIHFENLNVNSNSVALSTGDSAADINSQDESLVEYTVTLKEPGDFYEFTVDAVNDGSIDGMIGEVISKLNGTVISPTNPLPAYLAYSVTYSDGAAIATNQELLVNGTETIKVRVEFRRNIENNQLPTTDTSNTFSFKIHYVQKDDAIAVAHPVLSTKYTINRYDSNNAATTQVKIEDEIPSGITQYTTAADAITALNTLQGSTVANPVYLKHALADAYVTDSYVEFVISSSLAASSGMPAGTYTLKGAGASKTYDSTNEQYVYGTDSTFYADNKALLQTVFKRSNCSEGTNASGAYYNCYNNGFSAYINASGYVDAKYNGLYCRINVDGSSYCGQE